MHNVLIEAIEQKTNGINEQVVLSFQTDKMVDDKYFQGLSTSLEKINTESGSKFKFLGVADICKIG